MFLVRVYTILYLLFCNDKLERMFFYEIGSETRE